MLDVEEWRPVVGYSDYAVSSFGRVYSFKQTNCRGGFLKSCLNTKGYLIVGLSNSGRSVSYRVHRLVLEAFVGPCPLGKEAGHLDGVRTNNRIANLAWITSSENRRHTYLHGTATVGERNGAHKLTTEQVKQIRAELKDGVPASWLARDYGVDPATIERINHRISWAHV